MRRPVAAVAGAIGVSSVLCPGLLPWLFRNAMGPPDAARILISAARIAPLAFFMGMPFSWGLARVEDARLIPWAWGINGCASVTGAVLATLLAIHVGFTAVMKRGRTPVHGSRALRSRTAATKRSAQFGA
jgi:hypothetical protein